MTDEEKNKIIIKKIQRARSTLSQIPTLLSFGYLDTAISRMYYASFYAVQALLFSIDVKPKSHKGILNMFSLHFVKNGKAPERLSDFYATIFHQRSLVDYSEVEDYNQEMCESLYSLTKEFVQFIEQKLVKN